MLLNRFFRCKYKFCLSKNSINLSKDYYHVLKIKKGCDEKSIKNSYLKLVKSLHPDLNPNGKEKFTEVQEAYEILSNKQLKSFYDLNRNKEDQTKKRSERNSNYNKTSSQNSSYSAKHSENYQQQAYRTHQSNNTNNSWFYQTKYQNQGFQKQKQSFRNDQNFKRQKKENQNPQQQNLTPEQKKMRQKLRQMRGFTSGYNVLWNRKHLKYKNLFKDNQIDQNRNHQEAKKIFPEKLIKFYDQILDKLQKITKK